MSLARIQGVEGHIRVARKDHRCTPFFSKQCVGTGTIKAGEYYFETYDQCLDAFHPSRVCTECFNRAKEQAS